MPELHPYDVVVNGTETTLMLTDEDAKARGFAKAQKAAPAPANKARAAQSNKTG